VEAIPTSAFYDLSNIFNDLFSYRWLDNYILRGIELEVARFNARIDWTGIATFDKCNNILFHKVNKLVSSYPSKVGLECKSTNLPFLTILRR
jgi:hypothetical protein